MPKKNTVFADKLWNLVRAGQAIKISGKDKITTIVATGAYTGTWTYTKSRRRLSYSPTLPDADSTAKTTAGKIRKLPLPPLAYSTNEVRDYSYHIAHQTDRVAFGWMTLAWKKFRARQLLPMAEITNLVLAYFPKCEAYKLDYYKHHLKILVALAWPEISNEINAERTHALGYKLAWLSQQTNLIKTLGVRKRQRFVARVIKLGVKKALRLSFPRAHHRTLNDIAMLSNDVVVMNRNFAIDARNISSIRGDMSLSMVQAVSRLNKDYPTYKKDILAFAIKHSSVPFIVSKLDDNQAIHPIHTLNNFLMEFRRMKSLGIEVPTVWLFPKTAKMAHAYHDEATYLIDLHYKSMAAGLTAQSEHSHRKNWKDLGHPSEWRPLLTLADFELEHKNMRHCINSYFNMVSAIYAHVEKDGEAATLMIDLEAWTLTQAFGSCNQPISAVMSQHIQRWMKLNRPAVVKLPS